jgi:ribose transport system permease protein
VIVAKKKTTSGHASSAANDSGGAQEHRASTSTVLNVSSHVARPGAAPALFIVLVCIVMGVASPGFTSLNGWYFMVNESVFIILIAVGMTVVLIVGGIDLSVGSGMAVAAALSGLLLLDGVPMALVFVIVLLVGVAVGLVNGLLITYVGIPDFIATLAMLTALRGVLLIWTQGNPVLGYVTHAYGVIGGSTKIAPYLTVPMLLTLAVAIAGSVLLRYTVLGRHIHAVGGDGDAAVLMGVRAKRVKIACYVISGVLAALSGILLAGYLSQVSPGTTASGYELMAVAAAVLGGASLSGGRGSVFGACLGAIALTVITNLLSWWNVNPNWSDVLVGVLILLAALLQRAGVIVATRGGQTKRPRLADPQPVTRAPQSV